jgi:hypothetical protein
MAKTEIGFGYGSPQNPEKKWEKKLGNTTVIYTKTCVGDDFSFFIYNCECRRGGTTTGASWQTSSDMTLDEVEGIPRFVDLIAGK